MDFSAYPFYNSYGLAAPRGERATPPGRQIRQPTNERKEQH
jgi:hypothetical protein